MIQLTAVANSDFARFNPGAFIAAVNALLPLGKDGALAAIERYLVAADRSRDPQHGLLLVLRLLFEVPASGFHPPLYIGIPKTIQPADPKSLPHFPLILIDDIPLLLVTSFLIGGLAQPVEDCLKYYRENGILRAAPLNPPAAVAPAEILQHAAQLYRRAYGQDPKPAQLKMLAEQLQRMATPS